MKTMQRKLMKIGNSVGFLIPKSFLNELSVGIGDMVDIQLSKIGEGSGKKVLNPEVIKWVNEFIEEYKPMLKNLHAN